MKHYITLLVDTDRDPAHIAELIAQRAYTIDGVEDCEVLHVRDWLFSNFPKFTGVSMYGGPMVPIGGLEELEAREPIV